MDASIDWCIDISMHWSIDASVDWCIYRCASIDECIDRWMHLSMDASIDQCINRWMPWYINVLINECLQKLVYQFMDASIYGCIHWSMNQSINAFIYQCIERSMHRFIDASMDQCIDRSMHQSTDALPVPDPLSNYCAAAVQCPIPGPPVIVPNHCRNDKLTFCMAYCLQHTKPCWWWQHTREGQVTFIDISSACWGWDNPLFGPKERGIAGSWGAPWFEKHSWNFVKLPQRLYISPPGFWQHHTIRGREYNCVRLSKLWDMEILCRDRRQISCRTFGKTMCWTWREICFW